MTRSLAFTSLVALVAAFAVAPAALGQAVPKSPPASPSAPATPKAPPAATPATPSAPPAAAPASEAPPAAAAPEFVLFKTSFGDILLELNPTLAPISVANFLEYVNSGFYDGTCFHRVLSNAHNGFAQGGGFDVNLVQKKTNAPIKNEWQNGLKNLRGTIAMARTDMPDTATSQFFFNTIANTGFDTPMGGGAGYAVFGRVVKGMEIVDKIANIPLKPKTNDKPSQLVVITKASKLSTDDAKKLIGANPAEKPADKPAAVTPRT